MSVLVARETARRPNLAGCGVFAPNEPLCRLLRSTLSVHGSLPAGREPGRLVAFQRAASGSSLRRCKGSTLRR